MGVSVIYWVHINAASQPGYSPPALIGSRNNALREVQEAATKLVTGQRINRGADGPAALISSENFRAVLAALEAEAYTLQRADAVANTADGYLAEASTLLADNRGLEVQLANTAGLAPGEAEAIRMQVTGNQQAVARITNTAAFNGSKLFDGSFQLRVGGGQLALPDLAVSLPTREAIATLRGRVGAFQAGVVGSRLAVVNAAIQSTAQTESMIRDTDYAKQTAALARAQTLVDATTLLAQNPATVGGLLDLMG